MDEAHCATPKSCRECHRTPVSGAASQVSQVRVGHLDAHGPSQNAEIPYPNEINPLFRESVSQFRTSEIFAGMVRFVTAGVARVQYEGETRICPGALLTGPFET